MLFQEERKGRNGKVKSQEISGFYEFILDMDLIDVPVSVKKFLCFCSNGVSMSRLDIFLLSEGLVSFCNWTVDWVSGYLKSLSYLAYSFSQGLGHKTFSIF